MTEMGLLESEFNQPRQRRELTPRGTIRKFVVAGQFIEVLRCFENGMTEEMEQKLQYARWKAADGAKALREGREPVSGPRKLAASCPRM